MKIEKIQKMKNGKYKIELDNHEKIITYDDVILKNKLLYQKKLAEEQLNKLENDTQNYDLYYQCIKLIARKIRSEKEVRDYIIKLVSEDREDIIKKLKQNGFINDKIFTSAFCYDRLHLSNDGPLKIKKELAKHNIPKELIEQEFLKYDEKEIDLKLEKLMKKKIFQNTKYSKTMLRQKLFYYFSDLGYEVEKINYYFDKYYVANNTAILKEYNKIKKALEKKYPKEENSYRIIQKLYQKGYSKEEIDEIIKDEN